METIKCTEVPDNNVWHKNRDKFMTIKKRMKINGCYLRYNNSESSHVIYFIGSDGIRRDLKLSNFGEVERRVPGSHSIEYRKKHKIWEDIKMSELLSNANYNDIIQLTLIRYTLTGYID